MTFEALAKTRVTIASALVREAMQDAREEIASTFDNTHVHIDGQSVNGDVIADDIRNHRFSWEKDHA
jgi:hypothetical protein